MNYGSAFLMSSKGFAQRSQLKMYQNYQEKVSKQTYLQGWKKVIKEGQEQIVGSSGVLQLAQAQEELLKCHKLQMLGIADSK